MRSKPLVYDRLLADAVVLKLKIEAVGAKYLESVKAYAFALSYSRCAAGGGSRQQDTPRRNKSPWRARAAAQGQCAA